MSNQSFPSLFSLAPRQLSQLINPLYWLNNGTDQIGFINISGTASAKPAVEADIIENVATYGRQLGRISDLLVALLGQIHTGQWPADGKKAVEQFRDMTAQIAAIKAGYLAPTQQAIDKLVAGINSLKDTDPNEFARIKNELRRQLDVSDKDHPPAAHRTARGKGSGGIRPKPRS